MVYQNVSFFYLQLLLILRQVIVKRVTKIKHYFNAEEIHNLRTKKILKGVNGK